EERVPLVGLLGEAEAEQVGDNDPLMGREMVDDAVPVVRRRREAVEDEDGNGNGAGGVDRGTVDDEQAAAPAVVVLAAALPRGGAGAVVTCHQTGIVSCGAVPLITAANRKWWVVIAMSGVMILLTVDFFGITVALPRIGEDLDASTTTLLWTVNAYLLA